MFTMSWEPLPAAVGIGVLSIAAVSQAVLRRVPNALTIHATLAGWSFAGYADATHRAVWPGPAFLSSVVGTFLALVIMLPIYKTKRLGAGCVKAQMAFASWMGDALPPAASLALTVVATIAGLAATFALLHLTIPDIPPEKRRNYEFPAQVTMTIVAVGGALACWMISYRA